MLDPDMSNPTESESQIRITDPDPNPTHIDCCQQQEKITLSAPQLEETGMTVYPVL